MAMRSSKRFKEELVLGLYTINFQFQFRLQQYRCLKGVTPSPVIEQCPVPIQTLGPNTKIPSRHRKISYTF
jgi:hypothetical protein